MGYKNRNCDYCDKVYDKEGNELDLEKLIFRAIADNLKIKIETIESEDSPYLINEVVVSLIFNDIVINKSSDSIY